MKDFDKVEKDEVKIVTQKQIEKKKVFLGSVRLRLGHTCFEINRETIEVKAAEFKTSAEFGKAVRKEIVVTPGCVYVIALNKKNALKKFNKTA